MSRKIATTPISRRAQSHYALCQRDLGPDHPRTRAAERTYRAERWLASIQVAATTVPELDAAQRIRLAAMLAPVVSAAQVRGQAEAVSA